jgi:hypothetical protein
MKEMEVEFKNTSAIFVPSKICINVINARNVEAMKLRRKIGLHGW